MMPPKSFQGMYSRDLANGTRRPLYRDRPNIGRTLKIGFALSWVSLRATPRSRSCSAC